MSRENEEDVSGIDDIFDDNKDNINKFPKSDETSVSDSDTIVDQEENELEQDTIQEANGTTEKGDGQEEEGGGEEEGGESNPSSLGTSTSTTTTTTTTTPATTVNSATSEEGGGGGTASATVVVVVDVSRDGSQLVYVANQRVYLRGMDDLEPSLIPGSDLGGNILNPVLSPDGREVAFWYGPDGTIRRLAVAGGAALVVSSSPPVFGMRWDEEGLVFGQTGGKEIARVSPAGGTPEVIVKVGDDELASSPQLLPDGRGVLFSLRKTADVWDKAQVVVQTADGSRKVLVNGGADGRFVTSGHLLYAVAGVLMAVPFDLERLEVTGGAVQVVEGVRRASSIGTGTATAQFSVANNGSLVYVPGPARLASEAGDRRLAIYDGKGGIELMNMPLGSYQAPRVSRNGRTVAFENGDDTTVNVWVVDLDGKSAPRRLTFGGQNRAPVWSADGQWVAFQSDREGDLAIYRQRADGSAAAERLTKPEKGIVHIPQSWSPDGAQRAVLSGKQPGVHASDDGGCRPENPRDSRRPIGVFDRGVLFSRRPLDCLPDLASNVIKA